MRVYAVFGNVGLAVIDIILFFGIKEGEKKDIWYLKRWKLKVSLSICLLVLNAIPSLDDRKC